MVNYVKYLEHTVHNILAIKMSGNFHLLVFMKICLNFQNIIKHSLDTG